MLGPGHGHVQQALGLGLGLLLLARLAVGFRRQVDQGLLTVGLNKKGRLFGTRRHRHQHHGILQALGAMNGGDQHGFVVRGLRHVLFVAIRAAAPAHRVHGMWRVDTLGQVQELSNRRQAKFLAL